MKKISLLILSVVFYAGSLVAQNNSTPDFIWGNTAYFNLNIGESIHFLQKEVKLLAVNNLCNTVSVDGDTINLKISQRTNSKTSNGIKIFVADNRNLNPNDLVKQKLLSKDALIALCNVSTFLLDERNYVFPITFNEGFTWNLESDNYLFSTGQSNNKTEDFLINYGINFNLQNENGVEKHWMIAIENSKVAWIKNYENEKDSKRIAVLLESESQPGIYYFYDNLYKGTIEVRKGQRVLKGDLIGTVLGEKTWGETYFSVIKNDTIPDIMEVKKNIINFFPQLFELYFNKSVNFQKMYTKGNIRFGNMHSGNEKNNLCFEQYSGKGWILDCWSKTNNVPFATLGDESNVRLNKKMFAGTSWESVNPRNYYDFEISVNNGRYRIRAKLGDVVLPTWQRIEFEDHAIGEFSLSEGEMDWTVERIVNVDDGKLTVRIYVDPENKTAGISEIVFQKVL